jgi:hypothetical protein
MSEKKRGLEVGVWIHGEDHQGIEGDDTEVSILSSIRPILRGRSLQQNNHN